MVKQMNLKSLRAELISLLKDKKICECEADLSLILMHILKIDKTQLVLGEYCVSSKEKSGILNCVERLISGEPVQYIIGKSEFMSLEFITEPGVLIPRADTEILVEAVMDRLDKSNPLSVMDICCGSGCIGISLAYYMKNISVTALDISDTAIEIAKKNADLNRVSDRVEFLHTDIMYDMPTIPVDCIVSNPPYIKSDIIQTLDPKVREFEPQIALDGGADGLDFYRRIAENANLKDGGLLAFEIGFDQGDSVTNILKENNYTSIEVLQDIENRDRVVLGYLTKSPVK